MIKRLYYKYKTKNPYQDINDKYKMIFVHIPKNAGISIEEALFHKKVGHKSIKQFQAHDAKRFEEYWKFTIVRNPYDRLVSAFHFLKKGGRNSDDANWAEKNLKGVNDFKKFIETLEDKSFMENIITWQHFIPQFKYLIDFSGKLHVDYIGKMEILESDFEEICDKLKISNVSLEHKNKSDRKHWTEYYDESMKKIVHGIYFKDFELLGYEK